ncbi:MAG: STAS domain-containing protein [Bacteroidetes bacterium]|jgi:anti-sigma B factor antagonist|nr:STAS domain-containing protein [Bacteroidota bacterium]
MSFTFNIIQKEPVAIISLYGELIDRNEAQHLMDQIDGLSDDGQKYFILELSELKYMNSTGLNVLINVLTKSRKKGGDLVICGVSKKVQELLLVTKLTSVFSVSESTEDALTKFNVE